jgi:hypothetical protein
LESQQLCRRSDIKHDTRQLEYKLTFKISLHFSCFFSSDTTAIAIAIAIASDRRLSLHQDTLLQAPEEGKRKPVPTSNSQKQKQ